MRLIGLTGPAGSGKDTVADLLCSQHGFVKMAFADPLREGLKAMFPWITAAHLTDRALKEAPLPELGKSPRQMLQTLGTEWARDLIHPEIWLIAASHRLAQIRASRPCLHIAGVVVSDVRFENEADWVRDHGGQVWHLRRERLSPVADHISEAGVKLLPFADEIILNTSTMEALEAEVAEAMGVEA